MSILTPIIVLAIMLLFEYFWEALPIGRPNAMPNQMLQNIIKGILIALLVAGLYYFPPLQGKSITFLLAFIGFTVLSAFLELLYFGITQTANSLDTVVENTNPPKFGQFNRNDGRWIIVMVFSGLFSIVI